MSDSSASEGIFRSTTERPLYCLGCGLGFPGDRFTDTLTGRPYCQNCARNEKTSSRGAYYRLLDVVLPLGTGCRVECRTAGVRYEGNGTIVEVSEDLRDGGTPEHPAYLVSMDGTAETLFFTAVCLTRISESITSH